MIQKVQLGNSDLRLSKLIYGTWRLADQPEFSTPQSVLDRINACLELGITTFDLADIYGGYTYEALFGQALALDPSIRSKIQIITKCGILYPCDALPEVWVKHYNTSKEYIVESALKTLRLLNTDHIDLLLIHRPDHLMNPTEIAEAFTFLKSQNKVNYFGVSNFSPSQFDLIQSCLSFPLVSNQIEASVCCLLPFIDGQIDHLYKNKVAIMAWSPLGGGKLFDSSNESVKPLVKALEKVAGQLGSDVSIVQVAYSWLLTHPSNILPVIGTNKISRIRDLAKSVLLKLDRQQWFSIWEASMGKSVP